MIRLRMYSKEPVIGTIRTKWRFLWTPRVFDGHWYWLRWALVVEQFVATIDRNMNPDFRSKHHWTILELKTVGGH
jgi:hypothetical protein